jgi:DNA-binding MarR family transcriptional regulator
MKNMNDDMNRNISDIVNSIQDLSWYFSNQGFDDKCCEGLTLVEYMTLKKVNGTQKLTMQEIAMTLNLTKSGISKVIDRLECRNYVVREQSMVDGRVYYVVITESGVNAIKNVTDRYNTYLMEALDAVDHDALVNMSAVLTRLSKAIHETGYIKKDI